MILAELSIFDIISNSTYGALAAVALWGLFCIVVVWTRVGQKRFKSESEQDVFMDDIEQMLVDGDFEGVEEYCDGDNRALPQMVSIAMNNRAQGFKRARQVMMNRFERDVMSDLDYRLSWVSTVIKSAPMIGLFGTVFGMMGAFRTLASAQNVEPSLLANDINIALRTTACGLAIAIPLMILVQKVNIRIAKMEDLVGTGVVRFLEGFKAGLQKVGGGQAGTGATVEAVAVQSPDK